MTVAALANGLKPIKLRHENEMVHSNVVKIAKDMQTNEWQLQITEAGEIFVEHFTSPRFKVQIIITNGQPDLCVHFKMNWKDAKQGDFYWHLKALEFYNNAPKPI